jgi:hypothetical protein
MHSSTGKGWAGYLRGSNVTNYTGADCLVGTGWCWGMNPLLTMEPGMADASGILDEHDLNSLAFPSPAVGDFRDFIDPYVIGIFQAGLGSFPGQAAYVVRGNPYAWNHGIAFPDQSIRSDVFYEATHAEYALNLRGAHTYGVRLQDMAPGSVRVDQASISPGVCTAVPSVAFSGVGTAAATAYLGILDTSTIAAGGTGYSVGDKIAFATDLGYNPQINNNPIAVVTSTGTRGSVTGFSFLMVAAQPGPTSHTESLAQSTTRMTLADASAVHPGDLLRVWLDPFTDGMGSNPDAYYIYPISVVGNTVGFTPALPQSSSANTEVWDFGRRISPGALASASVGPLSQSAASGSGVGFQIIPKYGVSTIFMTNFSGAYPTAPTVTIDGSHTACSTQPTATAILGGYPIALHNSGWIVGRNSVGTADLRLISSDVFDRTVIGFDSGIALGPVPGNSMSAGEVAMAKITASGTAAGAGVMKFEVVAGTNAGTCKLIAYAGTSTTPATIVDNVGSGC